MLEEDNKPKVTTIHTLTKRMHCLVEPVSCKVSCANELKFSHCKCIFKNRLGTVSSRWKQHSTGKFPTASQIYSSAIQWAAFKEKTTSGYCYTLQPSESTAGLNESCWTFLFLGNTTTQPWYWKWTRVGRPLPACWLWLLVDGAVMNDLSLLLRSATDGNGW